MSEKNKNCQRKMLLVAWQRHDRKQRLFSTTNKFHKTCHNLLFM